MEDRASFVGKSFPEYTFVVERGKIREFAEAIGDMKDIYLDPGKAAGAGYADVTVPPTFGTVINLWGGLDFMKMCEYMNIDPVKVLHGEQEYMYGGDIVAGDVITANTRLVDYVEKKNMHVYTLEAVYFNQRKEEVLKSRHMILELK